MPSICCRESLYVGESRVAPGEGCRLRSATIAIWSCQATIENARQCCIGPVRWPIAVGQQGWRPALVEEFGRVVNGQTCANRDTPAARRDERLGGRQGLVRGWTGRSKSFATLPSGTRRLGVACRSGTCGVRAAWAPAHWLVLLQRRSFGARASPGS